jgi:hypothetical protein
MVDSDLAIVFGRETESEARSHRDHKARAHRVVSPHCITHRCIAIFNSILHSSLINMYGLQRSGGSYTSKFLNISSMDSLSLSTPRRSLAASDRPASQLLTFLRIPLTTFSSPCFSSYSQTFVMISASRHFIAIPIDPASSYEV